jgi:chemotaxis protein MotB
MSDENAQRPIIIKIIKKVSGGGHGGAWKVAYADFVTAMMAFFLLLWLLNSTTQAQKEGLSEYFTPTTASVQSVAGADGVLEGVSINSDGSSSASVSMPIPDQNVKVAEDRNTTSNADTEEESFETAMANREQEVFENMAAEIALSIQQSAELSQLQEQVLIDVTEEGMRIQLVDQDNRFMFRPDTADLYSYAERMLIHIAEKIENLPNRISISGHTDSTPFRAGSTYTNWELSADRANTARRVLRTAGVPADRFAEVIGKASTELLLPGSPNRAENRRITILVIREAPTLPSNF